MRDGLPDLLPLKLVKVLSKPVFAADGSSSSRPPDFASPSSRCSVDLDDAAAISWTGTCDNPAYLKMLW